MRSSDIAIVSDAWYPQINGVVRTLDSVRRELTRAGTTVTMVTPEQFRTVACPTYPEIRLSVDAWLKVASLLDTLNPRHIHIATEGPLGIAARRYCKRRGLAFTTSFHTRFPEYLYQRFRTPTSWSYRWLNRFHAPASTVMVASPSLLAELKGRGFANVRLWSRGVDTDLFKPYDHFETLLNYPRPIYLYVGRISVEKNLEAFLSLTLPGTKLVVGDGPYLAPLRQQFPDTVFTGKKQGEQLAHYYAGSDVFVFPSVTDTFGLVMLEAMACGTPVAAYPVTGPVDVVRDPAVGVLDNDLLVAIYKALQLKRTDCARYAARFSWENCARQFAELLVPAGEPLGKRKEIA